MRKQIVAGNWKMNKTLQEGIQLTKEINDIVNSSGNNNVEIILNPPFVNLDSVVKTITCSRIKVGAQNCSSEAKGAFTGEVSAEMIKSVGCEYVIIGHSERRSYYFEDNTILCKKVDMALQNGLTPIFAVEKC
jgi:triosephosphate isomerase (TIM)